MGWWKIVNVESGGIDWNFDSGGPNINATIDNITNELVNGDGPADIMGDAIEKVIKEYEKEWKRKPKVRELQAVFNFCLGGVRIKLEE